MVEVCNALLVPEKLNNLIGFRFNIDIMSVNNG